MEAINIIYFLVSMFIIVIYSVLLFRYLNFFHHNPFFDYINGKNYSNKVSYVFKYISIIGYMVALFLISFIPFMLLMKSSYINATIENLMIFYFNELYDFLAILYDIDPTYDYNASNEIFFIIFFYNSIALFFICFFNCLAFFFSKIFIGKVLRAFLFTVIIVGVWEIISPVIRETYLNSTIRTNPLVLKVENSVMKVVLFWNDDVGDYIDKIRDKIFPNKKKDDNNSKAIRFIERTKKFR